MKSRIILLTYLLFSLVLPVISQDARTQEGRGRWRAEFAELKIELDPAQGASGLMRGDARLRLRSLGSSAQNISLDLNHELTVLSVTDEDCRPLSFDRNGASLDVHFEKHPPAPDGFTIRVRYKGSFSERVAEIDLLNAWVGPPVSYALTSGLWYPVISGGDQRSKGTITYLVPKEWVVASIGQPAAVELLPAGNRCAFTIDSPMRFSFAAGPFTHLRESIDGLDMGVYFLGGGPEKARYYLRNCAEMVRFFKEYFGLFPYPGYFVVELPQALLGKTGGGSYEGMTFYPTGALPDRFFSLPVFGHEIGHLWWGNFVRGTEGPVINEGLAQVSMGLYLEHVLGEKALRNVLKNGAPEYGLVHSARLYFRAIQSPKTGDRPFLDLIMRGEDLELGISDKDKFNTLHMLANSKGFFAFFMLRDLIGSEAFRQGLCRALQRGAWKTITLEDVRAEFEKAAGRDLKGFFQQWFFRKGAPEFTMSSATEAHGKNWLVEGLIIQVRDIYRVKAEIGFINGGSRETREIEISERKTAYSFLLPFKPESVIFDPEYKILRWADEFKFQASGME